MSKIIRKSKDTKTITEKQIHDRLEKLAMLSEKLTKELDSLNYDIGLLFKKEVPTEK